MAEGSAGERSTFAEWDDFAQRNAGNPHLDHDSPYSLAIPIIDEIKAAVPGFFTAEQERFERDLAQSASFGFFHRRVLGLTARDTRPDPESGASLQRRIVDTAQNIEALQAEELRRDGLTDGEIDEFFQQRADHRDAIENRMAAYAGWLISRPTFLDEVNRLRGSYEAVVRALGGFPSYPRWPFVTDQFGQDAPREFTEELFHFYRRWGLDRMLTWDWPVPMEPDLFGETLRAPDQISRAGIVLFIPWYLLRGEKLAIQGVIRRARTACEEEHLWDWLGRHTAVAGDVIGDTRYDHMRWIYRYRELAIGRRYGTASGGRIQSLDRALARVLGRDEDSVKKLRLELLRRRGGTA